jgi:hypothetical protein
VSGWEFDNRWLLVDDWGLFTVEERFLHAALPPLYKDGNMIIDTGWTDGLPLPSFWRYHDHGWVYSRFVRL